MQTFGRSLGVNTMMLPRTLTVLLCIAMVLLLVSCQKPRVEGSEQAESKPPDACETAYALATDGSAAATDASIPLSLRYLSALDAPQTWTQVALDCPGRFAEGSLRSAQTQYRLDSIRPQLGLSKTGVPRIDFQKLAQVQDSQNMATGMSLAEDRAGFAMGVLAARGGNRQELTVSDEHKSAAQQLLVHSGSNEDPRQKVYAVSELIAHPDTITDAATGLNLPTTAVIEIGCVREELATVNLESATDDSDSQDDATDEQTNSQMQYLEVLSQLVSSRAYTAFTYGYPNTDAALFVQSPA